MIDPFAPHPSTARVVHAIEFKVVANEWLGFIVWPDCEPKNPCSIPFEKGKSWLDMKAGDPVLMKRKGETLWTKYAIERVKLFRVFPIKDCDIIVTMAREWVEGK